MSDTVRTWRHIQQRYNIIGSKCTTCGELFFPSRVVCPNCRRKGNLEAFQFSGKGKIHTFSVIRSPSDDFKKIAPYAVAVIDRTGAEVGLEVGRNDAATPTSDCASEGMSIVIVSL